MKISVIIPAYNEEGYLDKTLVSIENQTYPDYEIIVVANGCTDNTIEIAKKHADRILKVDQANASLARNLGAERARGAILVFLDADTRLAPNAFEEIAGQFRRNIVVATLAAYPNKSNFFFRFVNNVKNFMHTHSLYAGSSGVIVVSRALFYNVKGFDAARHIAETSRLIRKLNWFGKYSVISGTHAITSTRRYESWGVFRTAWFWIVNRWILRRDARYEAVR